VREDAQILYGFLQRQDRDLFRTLIKVNGVGPKLALSILSTMTADEFVQCEQNNEVTRLVNIPGIGKKTAERLVIETRDGLANWSTQLTGVALSIDQQHFQDAVSALTALGYKPHDAQRAVKQVQQIGRNSEELIRFALQNKVPGGHP
jgi:holliday junction DNA helicase RuvA